MQKVDYKTVVQNTDFIIPIPMQRPEEIPERQPIDVPFVKHPPERDPGVPQSAPPYEDDSFPIELDIEEISIPQVLYQAPEVAIENGNPSLLFGGEDGFDPGEYIVKFKPKIKHGKLRVDPTPLEAGDGAGMAGRYVIIPGHGAPSNEHTTANTTDQYLQVPDSTTVEEEWSQRIIVGCSKPETPSVAEFIWTDFKADSYQNDFSNRNLRTLHPKARHIFFAFVNKCEEVQEPHVVISGLRTPEEQDALYCQSFEKSGVGSSRYNYCVGLGFSNGNQKQVTNAKRWQSNHNYGIAIDMYRTDVPYPYTKHGGPTEIEGRIGDAFNLTWGGRWDRKDQPHFQLNAPTWRDLRTRHEEESSTFSYGGNLYVKF